ncbi:DUF1376 domain-containing protein [Candidatus Pacearchaeota archaeon]|nr:DUF1376 domain-containing protein [Candidatus Pacearchaeota archaeon]
MAKKPLYIQLEPGAYPKDSDWQTMSGQERGCYHSLVIFLACNNGVLANKPARLAALCNVELETFVNFWRSFSHKFIEKNGDIQHKRINAELAKARKMIRQKSLAGKASGNARSTAVKRVSDNRGTADELSKGKGSKEKKRKENYLLSLNKSYGSFYSWMESEFKITTKQERGTFTKYAKLYAGLCSVDKGFNGRINAKLLDMKEQAKGDKLALNKMFITSINKEIEKLKCPVLK